MADPKTGGGKDTSTGISAAARKSNNLKFIIPGVACLVVVVAVILLIVALQGERDPCTEYLKQMAADDKDESLLLPMSPIDIRSCVLSTCSGFDVSTCDIDCPFGYISNDEKGCPASCECAMEGKTEGDVAFNPAAVDRMLEEYGYVEEKEDFAVFFGWGWSIYDDIEVDGRFKVPYKVDDKFDPAFQEKLKTILKDMSRLACLDFEPRTDERDYLYFFSQGFGCEALVGKTTREHYVNLPFGCRDRETIEHETLHALGFSHEHTRPDRDGYVDIYLENINSYEAHNFRKKTWSQGKWLGTEYELTSALQYESHAFKKSWVSGTSIEGKGRVLLRSPTHGYTATPGDLKELNLLYGCEDITADLVGAWLEWGSWSGCTASCDKGTRKRFRKCQHQETKEMMMESACGEQAMETADCLMTVCSGKENEWSVWSHWTKECSATCGEGKRSRYRQCMSGYDGCDGASFEVKECYDMSCDTGHAVVRQHFGQWSDWGNWKDCDVTCGLGKSSRFRECMNGEEVVSEKYCTSLPIDGTLVDGKQKQSYLCGFPACATVWVNPYASKTTAFTYSTQSTPDPFATPAPTGPGYYQWGPWGRWTQCDVTCGEGKIQRKRECSGSYCPGKSTVTETCSKEACVRQGLFAASTSKRANVCIYGRLLVGKFDDDNAHDLICVYPDGCVRVYTSDVSTREYIPDYVTWEGKAEVCSFMGKNMEHTAKYMIIYAADVNGDGRDDLICRNEFTKYIFNSDGQIRIVPNNV